MATQLVDEVALKSFLDERGIGAGGVRVSRIPQGHSNLTFVIERGEDAFVLRRPPRGEILPTTHDMAREFRILSALHGTSVPVPEPLALCEDPSLIGAPFYVMSRVEGVSIRERLPDVFMADVGSRAGLAEKLIDTLAAIHMLDWRACGLEGLGRPDGYLERQLRRWSQLLMAVWSRELPDLLEVGRWLQSNLPESPPATLVHGDYRLDNLMLLPEPPATVTAVVDWEMGTIGDPLADLGYLLNFWRDPGDGEMPLDDDAWKISELEGFPRRAQLVERYVAQTGLDVGRLNYYRVLAAWKIPIFLEASYRRLKEGMADDPWFERLEGGVPALARRALQLTAEPAGV